MSRSTLWEYVSYFSKDCEICFSHIMSVRMNSSTGYYQLLAVRIQTITEECWGGEQYLKQPSEEGQKTTNGKTENVSKIKD